MSTEHANANVAWHELKVFLLALTCLLSITINLELLGDWLIAKPIIVTCSVQITDNAALKHEFIGKGTLWP